MAISKFKRRYAVTLTPSVVDRFQGLAKRMKLPPSAMSELCEDSIRNVSDVFQDALDRGSMELSDLFKVMGKQMELIEEDKKADV